MDSSTPAILTPLTFQDAIRRLADYWAAQGCLIWQPFNTEVGAGTMNPATFLRVLGPEPWNVAYVEPSVRPDDSRYGDNPNRVQQHTQYQVILKPDPGNPQELYLGSLRALGIDTAKHDVRFVEDNWESPALGAWGLGWEVWLDGLEITQFTYFQQAGGIELDPVAVEITYGLERIVMALQGADHFKKIAYNEHVRYGEAFGDNEYEQSVYNLDQADVGRIKKLFELYEQEARMLLGKGLALPAYTYVLKTSHVFNLLDARGAVGVTERARFFGRMRELARDVATVWANKRKEHGYPLLKPAADPVKPVVLPALAAAPTAPADFVLELGSEELPADDIAPASAQLASLLTRFLAEQRLKFVNIEIASTPRRLAAVVRRLDPRQPDQSKTIRGPRVSAAFDAAGKPTPAVQGFARKNNVDPAKLSRVTEGGEEYLAAVIDEPGKPAGDVLAAGLPSLIAKLTFPKTMRWNQTNVGYARPLRWIVALLGNAVVPFTYAGVTSGRATRPLRNAPREQLNIPEAADYLRAVSDAGIVFDPAARKQAIWQLAQQLAGDVHGRVPESAGGALLDEIVHLVEHPTPIRGIFAAENLSLPRDVLVTVMATHQRYLPVEDASGQLLPYFITVANGTVDKLAVQAGNEAVIRARYADAAFFYQKDTRQKLADFRGGLSTLAFQAKLGSMLQKNERLDKLVPTFAKTLKLSAADTAAAERAAYLAKADLATNMVVEMTSLAGVMGREYALSSGEPPAVAQAIFDHVLPRNSGDALPQSLPGRVVGIADRLDTLVGLFAVGLAPKSTSDPFALRRAALGLVQTLAEKQIDFNLRTAADEVAKVQPVPVPPEAIDAVLDFIRKRFEQTLLDRGERRDLVAAVLSTHGDNPAVAVRTLKELIAAVASPAFAPVLTAYSRPARLVKGKANLAAEPDAKLFETPEERTLAEAVTAAAAQIKPTSGVADVIDAFGPLVGPINAFFEKVFVMVENKAVANNRLALLGKVARLPAAIVDFTQVEGF